MESRYEYDTLNRITFQSITKDGDTTTTLYAYDCAGNIVSEATGADITVYEYDTLNQLTAKYKPADRVNYITSTGQTYSYDKDGNLTSIYDFDKRAMVYTASYNADGQVVKSTSLIAENGVRSVTNTYEYDGAGYLVEEVSSTITVSGNKTLTTNYRYDYTEVDPTVLRESRSDGTIITYTYGDDTEKITANVYSSRVWDIYDETYILETDYLGSVRWAQNEEGEVVAKTSYDIWGNITNNDNIKISPYIDDVDITSSYAGYIYDKCVNLWQTGARSYNPEIKRFTSEDPVAGDATEIIRMNKYVFACNNPLRYIDPDGRTAYDVGTNIANAAKGTFCKVACETINTWIKFNEVMSKIPAQYKFAIGTVGGIVAYAAGAPVLTILGVVALASAKEGMIGGAMYAFANIPQGHWDTEEYLDAVVSGALDGYMFAGVTLGRCYVKQTGAFNKVKNNFVKSVSTEDGSLDISGFKMPGLGGKSGNNPNVKVDSYYNMTHDSNVSGQAHHLSQDATFRDVIPTNDGLCVELNGNAFRDIGSGHYEAHKNMEAFWNQYRKGGDLYGEIPTIGTYNSALYNSLKAGGVNNKNAAYAVRKAYGQQMSYGLSNTDLVPRIPGRINQRK